MTENADRRSFAERVDEDIARNLRRARERRGLSQSELARRITDIGLQGFHQTTIARLETSQRALRAAEAFAVCQVLGISLETLAASPSADQLQGVIESAGEQAIAFDEATRELMHARRELASLLDTYLASIPNAIEASPGELLEASHALEVQFAAENLLSDSDPLRRLVNIYRSEIDAASRDYPAMVDHTHLASLLDSMDALLGRIEGVDRGEHQTEA